MCVCGEERGRLSNPGHGVLQLRGRNGCRSLTASPSASPQYTHAQTAPHHTPSPSPDFLCLMISEGPPWLVAKVGRPQVMASITVRPKAAVAGAGR